MRREGWREWFAVMLVLSAVAVLFLVAVSHL